MNAHLGASDHIIQMNFDTHLLQKTKKQKNNSNQKQHLCLFSGCFCVFLSFRFVLLIITKLLVRIFRIQCSLLLILSFNLKIEN